MTVASVNANHVAARRWRFPLPVVLPILLFALWWVAANRHWMTEQILPTPALVGQTALELAADNLFPNLWISIQRLVLGLAAGVAVGAVIGLAMGASRRLEAAIYPTFIALVQIPTLAWIPLFVMWFGLGEALKIAVIVKAVATPVAINTHVGVRDVEPRLREAARVLRLPRALLLRRLVLPAALPSFMTGLRLGLAQAWISLLAAELLASSEGIGYLMVWGRQLFQLDIVFVCIVVIGVVGVAMDQGFSLLDRHILRWPPPALAARPGRAGWGDRAWSFGVPLGLLALWALSSARGWVPAAVLPAPVVVGETLRAGFADGSLVIAIVASLQRWFFGMLIGGTLGLAVGLAMGLIKPVNRLLDATLTAMRLVALFAWLPLITAWTGLGELSKVTFIAIACFYPMQVASQRGVATLSVQLGEAARALRLSPWLRLRLVVLPGAAPAIFAGFRLTLATAWIATVGAEYFMASGAGIGGVMINAQQGFKMEVVIAAMILIGLAAAVIGWAGQRVEAVASRWRSA